MDRTRASEACDVGSIPAGGTKNVRRESGEAERKIEIAKLV